MLTDLHYFLISTNIVSSSNTTWVTDTSFTLSRMCLLDKKLGKWPFTKAAKVKRENNFLWNRRIFNKIAPTYLVTESYFQDSEPEQNWQNLGCHSYCSQEDQSGFLLPNGKGMENHLLHYTKQATALRVCLMKFPSKSAGCIFCMLTMQHSLILSAKSIATNILPVQQKNRCHFHSKGFLKKGFISPRT